MKTSFLKLQIITISLTGLSSVQAMDKTRRFFTTSFMTEGAVEIVPHDKIPFLVDQNVAKESAKIAQLMAQTPDQPVLLPETNSHHLSLLLSLAEWPLAKIPNTELDELIEILKTEIPLDFNKKLVKSKIFKAIAKTLTWDEQSIAKVLANNAFPEMYKEEIIGSFVKTPQAQSALAKGQKRAWTANDIENLLSNYRALPHAAKILLIKGLIEAREGLLEAIVGDTNVHEYRCRANPEEAAGCTFAWFATPPTKEDQQLNEDLESILRNEYTEARSQLMKKYSQ